MDKECQEIISDWTSWVSRVSFKAHGGKKLGSRDENGVFIVNPDGFIKKTRGMMYTQHVKFSDQSWSFFDLTGYEDGGGVQWNKQRIAVKVVNGLITSVTRFGIKHQHRVWDDLKIPVPIDYVRISDFIEEMSVERVNKKSLMRASVKYIAERNVNFKSGADLKEFVKRISEFVKWNDYENKWPQALEFILRASESEADEIVNLSIASSVHRE